MRRWINWQDMITFWGVPVVATVGSALLLISAPRAAVIGMFILSPVLLTMWIVCGYFFMKHWLRRPDIVTLMGTAVWTNGLRINGNDISDAINYYATNVGHFHPKLDTATVLSMFGQVSIEFTEDLVWFGRPSAIQRGYSMRIRWHVTVHNYLQKLGTWKVEEHEGFGYNDFFYACHKLVDEVLLDVPSDAPGRLEWWDMIPRLKTGWIEGAKKVSA